MKADLLLITDNISSSNDSVINNVTKNQIARLIIIGIEAMAPDITPSSNKVASVKDVLFGSGGIIIRTLYK